MKKLILILFVLIGSVQLHAQTRIDSLSVRLDQLANSSTPGLKERVDFSVVGVSIQEFVRGLAESNNLNISIDPTIDIKVYNNFTNEEVKNIILFLCKEYSLDVRFTGSIMSFFKYVAPEAPKPTLRPHEISIQYLKDADQLSFDLRSDTLEYVLKKITQLSQKNVVISPKVTKNKTVSSFIQNMPFENALSKMAYSNELKIEKSDDNFFIISPSDAEDEPVDKKKKKKNNNTASQTGNTYTSGGPSNASSGEFSLDIKDSLNKKWISFEGVNVSISDVIKEVSKEVNEKYFIFSDLKGNTTSLVSNVLYEDFLSYLLQTTDFTYKKENGIYLIGERKVEGLRSTKVVQLQYRSFKDVLNVIPADLKKGVEIKEFEELNSFILSGSTPQIVEIERFVTDIDKVVPMIMIEVILVDIKRDRSLSTTLRGGQADSIKGAFSILPGLDALFKSRSINDFISPLNIGKVRSDFYLGLKALETQNYLNVRSMPKLATLNGHEASMRIGETRYYEIKTQNVVGSLNPNTVVTQQFNSVKADMHIKIKPLVSGDDQVTMDIDVEISDFLPSSNATGPPPSATRQFTSMLRVRNEEMIILGGIEREEKSNGGSGVPILSRIPIIKWFFSSRTSKKGKTIFVAFIKPTIIH